MKKEKINIRQVEDDIILKYLVSINEKPFRLKQIKEWLWKKGAVSFFEMKNISKKCLTNLNNHFAIAPLSISKEHISNDRTIKYIFKTTDNYLLEGVLIPTPNRVTACISSQVGCTFKCKFCATGQMVFERDLSYDEIFDQILILKKQSEFHFSLPLSNIVFMGMGEPFQNYDNVSKCINTITSENSLHISATRITISTVGIPPAIEKLSKDLPKVHLAISLHSAISYTRKKIMPIEAKYNLIQLKKALIQYHKTTNNRITFEYLLLNGVNDSYEDVVAFYEYTKNIPCKINIIEYNQVQNLPFSSSDKKHQNSFIKYLESKSMIVNIRNSRGSDINAACGQLLPKTK